MGIGNFYYGLHLVALSSASLYRSAIVVIWIEVFRLNVLVNLLTFQREFVVRIERGSIRFLFCDDPSSKKAPLAEHNAEAKARAITAVHYCTH